MTEPGPTGEFPQGKINPDDEGELAMELLYDPQHDSVILNFNTSVRWIGMSPQEAIDFGERIAEVGRQHLGQRSSEEVV